jgi:hypothetical protein
MIIIIIIILLLLLGITVLVKNQYMKLYRRYKDMYIIFAFLFKINFCLFL